MAWRLDRKERVPRMCQLLRKPLTSQGRGASRQGIALKRELLFDQMVCQPKFFADYIHPFSLRHSEPQSHNRSSGGGCQACECILPVRYRVYLAPHDMIAVACPESRERVSQIEVKPRLRFPTPSFYPFPNNYDSVCTTGRSCSVSTTRPPELFCATSSCTWGASRLTWAYCTISGVAMATRKGYKHLGWLLDLPKTREEISLGRYLRSVIAAGLVSQSTPRDTGFP